MTYKAKQSVFILLLVGIIIVVVANVINIYTAGKKNPEKFIELSSLISSHVELPGDLFADFQKVAQALEHMKNIQKSVEKLKINSLEDVARALENHKQVALETADEIIKVKEELKNVNPKIFPEELGAKVEMVLEEFNKYSDLIDHTKENIPAIENLMGLRYPHRYLILFQNNNEARPTGGFIGSVMLIDINDGKLEKSEVFDVYDFDGQFHEYIEPPYEIKELTDKWRLRDSNYWPDFTVSGEKAAWFFQKEGGPSVDSVIAINQSILKPILEITGPISVPGLPSEITKENYDTVLSYIIESKLTGVNNPKEVLKNLVPIVQKELLKQENFIKLLGVIRDEIAQKNLLAYSRHNEVEKFFDNLQASGKMIKPKGNEDYLSVVTTSISGNKSDKYIEQELTHDTWITERGEVLNQISIKRSHTWNDTVLWGLKNTLEKFGFNDISDTMKDVLGRGANRSVIRVYVPKGSELLETTSISEIEKKYDELLDKEYFIFRMEVTKGEEKTVTIDYKLPFKLPFNPMAAYKLHIQKQPGNTNTTLIKHISGEGLKNLKNFPDIVNTAKKVSFEVPLMTDKYFASLWGR